jgi:DNA-binding FrmR family transcriptional regulator
MEGHIRENILRRLKRIEGQVRGIERMIQEGRECPEILQQIASIREALQATAKVILEGHVRHCTLRGKGSYQEEELLSSILRSIQAWK